MKWQKYTRTHDDHYANTIHDDFAITHVAGAAKLGLVHVCIH